MGGSGTVDFHWSLRLSWTYVIDSGRMYTDSGDLLGVGYSGDPEHKNNPAAQSLADQGPIPTGVYTIGEPEDTADHGPFVLPLTPDPTNEMYGRSAFLIHGDRIGAPGTASKGCIILARDVRNDVWQSGDRTLDVIATLPEDYFQGGN